MRRRTEMVLIGVVAGVTVIFAMKHGAGPGGGSGGGRACCPWMSGVSLRQTNLPAGTNLANTNSALTARESITNRAQ